jgi:hypothetical protein
VKVLVLDSVVPLAPDPGAARRDALVARLLAAGMEAEALRLPFTPEPAARLPDEILIARSLHVLNADRVVALAFPACLVPHAAKVIWLQNAPAGPALAGRAGEAVRAAEARALADARRVFAADAAVAAALRDAYGCDAAVLADIPDRFDDMLA